MDIENKSNKKLSVSLKELSDKHGNIKNEILFLVEKLDVIEKDYKKIITELKGRYKIN
tara:strand:+ start:5809 stop:5982 length:174 start_codon:yes stop_codon:yes gene_type:complete